MVLSAFLFIVLYWLPPAHRPVRGRGCQSTRGAAAGTRAAGSARGPARLVRATWGPAGRASRSLRFSGGGCVPSGISGRRLGARDPSVLDVGGEEICQKVHEEIGEAEAGLAAEDEAWPRSDLQVRDLIPTIRYLNHPAVHVRVRIPWRLNEGPHILPLILLMSWYTYDDIDRIIQSRGRDRLFNIPESPSSRSHHQRAHYTYKRIILPVRVWQGESCHSCLGSRRLFCLKPGKMGSLDKFPKLLQKRPIANTVRHPRWSTSMEFGPAGYML